MQFNSVGGPDILVAFGDAALQSDPVAYGQFVRQHGQCTNGGDGKTDLVRALNDAALHFNIADHREHEICGEVAPKLDAKGTP